MRDANSALLLCVFITGAVCMMDFIGKGQWLVNNVQKCPDSDDYPMPIEIKRRKMNRTHDGFNVSFTLPEDLTDTSHGIYGELCKHVDGGCKIQQILDDESCCHFIRKYAMENFVKALTMAGREPADCPIKAGDFSLNNFVFDYSELPENGLLGHFEAKIYLLKGKARVSCLNLDINFSPIDD